MELFTLSNYELIDLLYNEVLLGQRADIKPVSIDDVVDILEQRSGESHGKDVLRWIEWFINTSDVGTKEEVELMMNNKEYYEERESNKL